MQPVLQNLRADGIDTDVVSLDDVIASSGNLDTVLTVSGYDVAGIRPGTPNLRFRRKGSIVPVPNEDSVVGVAQIERPAHVGSDPIPLNHSIWRVAAEVDAVVARAVGDDVAGSRLCPANDRICGVLHVHPGAVVAKAHGTRGVGADVVALNRHII